MILTLFKFKFEFNSRQGPGNALVYALMRRERSSSRRAAGSARTRQRLIETAGRMFAERGFDAATGQAICRRARVHTAAIVYHFGGMAGLYRAVFEEARSRLLSNAALAAAVAAEHDPRRRLEAFIGVVVRALTGPVPRSWAGRLFSRELVTPSTVYGRIHDRTLAQRASILRSLVSALLQRAPSDPLVTRACISVMAPCAVMLLFNRAKLRRIGPGLRLSRAAAPELTRQLSTFALGGLEALAASGLR
jgi:TetR/AcrR family transcriptional regulator, regulator of cefoperazone and chloramphenicol sensitivity